MNRDKEDGETNKLMTAIRYNVEINKTTYPPLRTAIRASAWKRRPTLCRHSWAATGRSWLRCWYCNCSSGRCCRSHSGSCSGNRRRVDSSCWLGRWARCDLRHRGRTSSRLDHLADDGITPCSTSIMETDPEEGPSIACECSTVVCLKVGHDLNGLGSICVGASAAAVRDAVAKHNLWYTIYE
jgi:hypothetical protein